MIKDVFQQAILLRPPAVRLRPVCLEATAQFLEAIEPLAHVVESHGPALAAHGVQFDKPGFRQHLHGPGKHGARHEQLEPLGRDGAQHHATDAWRGCRRRWCNRPRSRSISRKTIARYANTAPGR